MASEGKSYTRDEVAQHNKTGDLWVVIHGDVYDLSKFNTHPGGQEVFMDAAGKDATMGFDAEDHSATAKKQMKDFLIGTLDTSADESEDAGAQLRAGKGVRYKT